jgi:hypothetical protein
MKEDKMGRTCRTHRAIINSCKSLVGVVKGRIKIIQK